MFDFYRSSDFNNNGNSICYMSAYFTDTCDNQQLTSYSNYWKVVKYLGLDGYYQYRYALVPVEYEIPEYNLSCDKEELKKGESTQCKITVSNKFNLKNVSFKLSFDDFAISEEKGGDLFELNKESDNYKLVAKSDDNVGTDNVLLQFKLTADKDKEVANIDNVKVTDINYEDEVENADTEDLSTTLKQKKNVISNLISNPKTYSQVFMFLGIIGVVVLTLFITTRKFNKNED